MKAFLSRLRATAPRPFVRAHRSIGAETWIFRRAR